MLQAVIKPEWAENIKEHEVFRFNTFSAEDLLSEVDVRQFGSLIIELALPGIVDQAFIYRARSVLHIVDLAFGEPAIETSTSFLRRASHEAYGAEHILTNQLAIRNRPTSEHGSNEPWFLPLNGITIVESAAVTAVTVL
jgi:hypothetical protein